MLTVRPTLDAAATARARSSWSGARSRCSGCGRSGPAPACRGCRNAASTAPSTWCRPDRSGPGGSLALRSPLRAVTISVGIVVVPGVRVDRLDRPVADRQREFRGAAGDRELRVGLALASSRRSAASDLSTSIFAAAGIGAMSRTLGTRMHAAGDVQRYAGIQRGQQRRAGVEHSRRAPSAADWNGDRLQLRLGHHSRRRGRERPGDVGLVIV